MGPILTQTILKDVESEGSRPSNLRTYVANLTKKFPAILKETVVLTRKLYARFGDFVKDNFVVITLGYLIQGGGTPLFWVFYSMIGCIVVPYLLAVINHGFSFMRMENKNNLVKVLYYT